MACLPATCFLFNKHWPDSDNTNVKILGYTKPKFDLPSNFEFVSLGIQRGPAFWSDDMFDFYSKSSCSHFYSIWEDAFILKPVRKSIISLANTLIEKDSKFFKFNLTADVVTRPHKIIKESADFDLVLADQFSRYRLSTQHCIWNKDLFLSKLRPSQTPWDFELNDKENFNDGLRIYATKRSYAVYMGHLYKNGKKRIKWHDCVYGPLGNSTHNVEGLEEELVRTLETKGWVPEI